MLIEDVMSINFTRIRLGATMGEAAELVSVAQSSDLMVVDGQNQFVGVLSEGDLIRAILPRFDELMSSGETLSVAYEVFADHGREHAARPVDPLVIKDPITFDPADDALKAASTMVTKQIRRLPVVDGGELVGTVSRADVCRALIRC